MTRFSAPRVKDETRGGTFSARLRRGGSCTEWDYDPPARSAAENTPAAASAFAVAAENSQK